MRRSLLAFLSLLVLAVGLTACGSSSKSSSSSSSSSTPVSSSQPGKGKPPIVLGDKNFTEEYLLGYLYKQALEAKGYTVNLKANLGSSEIADKALTSGKIDMYPEYTGVIVQELQGAKKLPTSGAQTYAQAKAFEEKRDFLLLNQTPFEDKDALAATKATATKKGLKTIADLKKLGSSMKLAGPPEFKTRFAGLKGLKSVYGLSGFQFKPLTIGLQYQALDQGKVDVADVFTTDGALQSGKYTVLTDPKAVFGFQNAVPVISKKLVAKEGFGFVQILNQVSAKLTTKAMQQMNAAVDVNKLDPKDVAQKFLKANGLL